MFETLYDFGMDLDALSHRPGLRTDAFALPGAKLHTQRDGYVAVHTPDAPSFWYGHRLLIAGPPWDEGVELWRDRWLVENPDPARRPPKAFICWEQPAPDPAHTERARAVGVELEMQSVSRHDGHLPPLPPRPHDLIIRPVRTAAEWAVVSATSERAFGLSGGFFAWVDAERRNRVRAGEAIEWGAFVEGALVGHCGLVRGDGEARFQDVAVDPDHHGRKIGVHLLAGALRHHAACHPGQPAWITADIGGRPERIYRALGFRTVSYTYSVVLEIAP